MVASILHFLQHPGGYTVGIWELFATYDEVMDVLYQQRLINIWSWDLNPWRREITTWIFPSNLSIRQDGGWVLDKTWSAYVASKYSTLPVRRSHQRGNDHFRQHEYNVNIWEHWQMLHLWLYKYCVWYRWYPLQYYQRHWILQSKSSTSYNFALLESFSYNRSHQRAANVNRARKGTLNIGYHTYFILYTFVPYLLYDIYHLLRHKYNMYRSVKLFMDGHHIWNP
jgi:hypothetical protein